MPGHTKSNRLYDGGVSMSLTGDEGSRLIESEVVIITIYDYVLLLAVGK